MGIFADWAHEEYSMTPYSCNIRILIKILGVEFDWYGERKESRIVRTSRKVERLSTNMLNKRTIIPRENRFSANIKSTSLAFSNVYFAANHLLRGFPRFCLSCFFYIPLSLFLYLSLSLIRSILYLFLSFQAVHIASLSLCMFSSILLFW